MFDQSISIEKINKMGNGSMVENLGIEFIEIGHDYLKAKMPVDQRTVQPFGLLHGGASVALAETLGSTCSQLLIDRDSQIAVGLEINANHLKSARNGEIVTAICKAIHVGRSTHVWEIRVQNQEANLVCISRLTVSILEKKNDR